MTGHNALKKFFFIMEILNTYKNRQNGTNFFVLMNQLQWFSIHKESGFVFVPTISSPVPPLSLWCIFEKHWVFKNPFSNIWLWLPFYLGFLHLYNWSWPAFVFIFFFCLFRTEPSAYDVPRQGLNWSCGLCHSHSSEGSKPCLPPTPQLMATPDP